MSQCLWVGLTLKVLLMIKGVVVVMVMLLFTLSRLCITFDLQYAEM